jgi:peroxidase
MSRSSRSRKVAQLQFLPLERRDVPSGVRSIDGTGNNPNPANFTWGSAGVDLLRKAPTTYADGTSAPSAGRPNARTISNTIVDQGSADVISQRGLAAMAYAWGQFIDHDMDLTGSASPAESFNITVPAGDQYFTPGSSISLRRSNYDTATGTTNARQQINSITAFLDGSMVYGSDSTVADKLRTHSGGRMKTSAGNLLPYNDAATFPTGTLTMANDSHIVPDSQLFAAGDVRANENIELTSLQTIFVREHNRIADQIHQAQPNLSDEAVYQQARAWVIAEIEAITYNQWLPTLLGPAGLQPYQGYKVNVNPGIANEFSTAGFRLGHSMLGDDVEFIGNNGLEVANPVALSQAFFNPPLLVTNGVDPILKYLASDPASEIDTTVVNSVRNFLFGPPGAGGLDLASLNIQRGRDHGLADYNSARVSYGLPPITSFNQITTNAGQQQKLRDLYGTTNGADNVNNVDLWVGMLAEDHVPGGNTGPLVARILVDQFSRLRDGDSFWYERMFSGPALQQLRNTSLADVIKRNTGLTNLQGNVFVFKSAISGMVFNDVNHNGHRDFNEQGISGRTLELFNTVENEVVATTTSGTGGSYSFDVLDGLRVGRYRVREALPTGTVETTPPQQILAVTRGDTFIGHVDFGNFTPGTPPPPPPPCPPGGPGGPGSGGPGGGWGFTSPNATTANALLSFQQDYMVDEL